MVTRLTRLLAGRKVLLLMLAMLLTPSVSAVADTGLPHSVVLVLKLVSTTRVKPVTGIVISEQGLVLIPRDFLSPDTGVTSDEIVVLDGGTDIVKNARPATVVDRSSSPDFAVLSVKGLRRPQFILSDGQFSPKSELHMAAFPAAEYIAQGAAPLWIAMTIQQDQSDDQSISLSPETPLPHISGPIIDHCGHLVGLNLANGLTNTKTSSSKIFFTTQLNQTLVSMHINLARGHCADLPRSSASVLEEQAVDKVIVDVPGQKEKKTMETVADEQVSMDGSDSSNQTQFPTDEPTMGTLQTTDSHAGTITPVTRVSLWRQMPLWLMVIVLVSIILLIWKIGMFVRLNKNPDQQTSTATTGFDKPLASDEPETTILRVDSGESPDKPRSAPMNEAECPDFSDLPDGCDGIFVLDGQLGTEARFKRFFPVNTQQFEVLIGRGDADISIELPAISRIHARIECHAGTMTLSDLDSNNGSYINRIPCLPEEVMYIEADDEIFLGDVRVRISIMVKALEQA